MSLSGDVATVGLEEVFGLLTANASRGVLTVRNGSSALRLYLQDGRIFLPHSDPEGIRSLSQVLEPDGVVAKAWKGLVSELRKRSDRWRRPSAREQETRRRRYTEEIHTIFLWDEARFEFSPGELPPRVAADVEAGRGLLIESQAVLFEVARRADERQRIRRAIPSGRVIFDVAPGAEGRVEAALQQVEADVSRGRIDGTQPLDRLLQGWFAPHYDVLAQVAALVEEGDVRLLEPDAARRRFRVLLDADDLRGAAEVLEHLSEIEAHPPGQVLDLEPALVNSRAFRQGQPVQCRLLLEGPRVFALVRELLDASTPFTLALQHGGATKRVSLLPGVLTVSAEPATDVPPAETYPGVLEQVADELAELVFWPRAEVELSNRGIQGDAPQTLVLPLTQGVTAQLRQGLVQWATVFADVPGEDAVFVASSKCQAQDPASRFFGRFSPARNLGELRRPAGAGRLQFTRLVHQGYKGGYLLRPTQTVLEAWIQSVRARENHIMTYRLLRAALAFGHEEAFAELREAYRGRDLLPNPEPALRGRLAGVGLPAVLQALRDHRHTGTLTVSAGDQEQRVHFHDGQLFMLQREQVSAEEFPEVVLGGPEGEGLGLAAADEVSEEALDPALVRRLKDRFLDVLFWEDADFAFHAHDLPEDFFTPSRRATKIALRTNAFLLEAIRRLEQRDRTRAGKVVAR